MTGKRGSLETKISYREMESDDDRERDSLAYELFSVLDIYDQGEPKTPVPVLTACMSRCNHRHRDRNTVGAAICRDPHGEHHTRTTDKHCGCATVECCATGGLSRSSALSPAALQLMSSVAGRSCCLRRDLPGHFSARCRGLCQLATQLARQPQHQQLSNQSVVPDSTGWPV